MRWLVCDLTLFACPPHDASFLATLSLFFLSVSQVPLDHWAEKRGRLGCELSAGLRWLAQGLISLKFPFPFLLKSNQGLRLFESRALAQEISGAFLLSFFPLSALSPSPSLIPFLPMTYSNEIFLSRFHIFCRWKTSAFIPSLSV